VLLAKEQILQYARANGTPELLDDSSREALITSARARAAVLATPSARAHAALSEQLGSRLPSVSRAKSGLDTTENGGMRAPVGVGGGEGDGPQLYWRHEFPEDHATKPTSHNLASRGRRVRVTTFGARLAAGGKDKPKHENPMKNPKSHLHADAEDDGVGVEGDGM